MLVSIVIVNWNSKQYLCLALKSICRTREGLKVQVVVVDNGSFDGAREMIKSEFPEVIFVQSSDNLGFARANNLALRYVRGDAVLFMNPDVELKDGALQTLVAELGRQAKVGILGPRILNSDGSLQRTCVRAFPTPVERAVASDVLHQWFPTWRLWGNSEAFRANSPVEVECLSGACMFMETVVFRQVGGFSPEFFMYGEDVDLCYKVRRLGLRLYYVPDATVIHHGGKSSVNQGSRFSTVAMREADYRLILKWQGKRAAVLYRVLQATSALVRIPLLASWAILHLNRGWYRAGGASIAKWWAVLRWAIGLERSIATLYGRRGEAAMRIDRTTVPEGLRVPFQPT